MGARVRSGDEGVVIPATWCDVCGFVEVVVRLRPLWLPLDNGSIRGIPRSRGIGEYDLCAGCRNRVLDALHPPVTVKL